MTITRRTFLRSLASGLLVAAVPEVLVPERRFWQVGRNAPVREWSADIKYVPVYAPDGMGTVVEWVDVSPARGEYLLDVNASAQPGDAMFVRRDGTITPVRDENVRIGTLIEVTSDNTGWVRLGGESYSNTLSASAVPSADALRKAMASMREMLDSPAGLRPDSPLICSQQLADDIDAYAKTDPHLAALIDMRSRA
jgi:hypothetical protein